MLQFFIRRLGVSLLVAVTVSVIGFALLRLSGDLASALAGETATPEEIARVAAMYGLDRPLYVQYFDWVWSALHGDLGTSLFSRVPVLELIVDHLGVTIALALCSLLLSLLVAIPLGVVAAMRPNTWIDRTALALAVFGQAIPNFWFALILIFVFAVKLQWAPVSGSDTWVHFILPTVTLGLGTMPAKMRLTRTGMIDALSSDFVRTARAKGLSARAVLFKHALRTAILPVVSVSAVSLGFLLGGSVIVESVFGLNGIGQLAFQSISQIDFPVVQSILVFLAFCYIFLTMLADLINARLDPRIKL
ncbi:ABC transporter permease [Pigmentiphaga sp. H8]|uniref:ABC transporter permease n=1 Tax=Pigmentiphaga sp. H8 TaxID=2488560 RepID=UPI000F5B092D|nr:ABC transporter permease [Pigmentiphaga sp. H8]AZG10554.1 ABC transporter permease [Pigmentiphaga sp. H8]